MRILLVILLLGVCNCSAMSLKESIQYALKHSPEYKQIVMQFEKDTNTYRSGNTAYDPQFSVSGNNSGKRSGSVSQKFSRSGSLNIDYSKYINSDTDGTTTYQISQELFKWRDYDHKINRLNYETKQLGFKKSRESFILKVINNFFTVLKTQERLDIEQNSYKRWELSLEYAKVKFESGNANKFDLLNAQVNLLSKESTIIQLKDSLERSKDSFKMLIGMPLTETFTAAEKIVFEKPGNVKPLIRNSLKISILNNEIAKLSEYKARDSKRPAIKYSAVYTDSPTSNFWSTAVNYSFQFGKSSKDYSYFNSRLTSKMQKLSLDLAKTDIEIEQADIKRKLKTSELSVNLSKKNLEIAEETYEYSKMSFQEGLVDIINLQDAQNKLTSAKQSYIFALIDNKILNFEYINIMGEYIENFMEITDKKHN